MDNAAEHVMSRVSHAHSTAANAILQFINRSIPNTGPAILQAPLFKAGKAPLKYATLNDTSTTEQAEFKEVVVTARHTHKLIVRVTQNKDQHNQHASKAAAAAAAAKSAADVPAQKGTVQGVFGEIEDAEQSLRRAENAPPPPGPKIDIRVDWSNALSSIVSVDPIFDTVDESTPIAIFSVVFLCPTKDAKAEDLPSAAAAIAETRVDIGAKNDDDDDGASGGKKKNSGGPPSPNNNKNKAAAADVVTTMMKKRTAFEWTLLALRRSSEVPLSAIEADHVRSLFSLGKPSVRCRAYLVPDILGGAAQRDEWVSVYRAAIQNYWQERLESTVIPAPEVFQWCGWAQYGGTTSPPASGGASALPSSSFCLVSLSTKKLYFVNAQEGNLLAAESGKIPGTAARSADVSTVSLVETLAATPFAVRIEVAKRPFAFLHFFCAQHAADFVLELQRVFELVCGQAAAFPIQGAGAKDQQ